MKSQGEKPPRKRRQKPLPLIAGRQFELLRDLEGEINRIRRWYRPHHQPVTGPDGELLWAWMSTHEALPLAEERHGPLCRIEIRRNHNVYRGPGRPECDQHQITMVFADGFVEPFSYRAAHNLFAVIPTGTEQEQRQWRWLKKAGRQLIADDIREFRDTHLETDGRCEISGEPLTIENADVHHVGAGFGWMLFSFLREHCLEHGLNGFDIEVIDTDNVGGKRFTDEALCEAWVQHHCEIAHLQVLTREVHDQQHVGLARAPFMELFNA